jgi:hypothetical protein
MCFTGNNSYGYAAGAWRRLAEAWFYWVSGCARRTAKRDADVGLILAEPDVLLCQLLGTGQDGRWP